MMMIMMKAIMMMESSWLLVPRAPFSIPFSIFPITFCTTFLIPFEFSNVQNFARARITASNPSLLLRYGCTCELNKDLIFNASHRQPFLTCKPKKSVSDCKLQSETNGQEKPVAEFNVFSSFITICDLRHLAVASSVVFSCDTIPLFWNVCVCSRLSPTLIGSLTGNPTCRIGEGGRIGRIRICPSEYIHIFMEPDGRDRQQQWMWWQFVIHDLLVSYVYTSLLVAHL